MPNIGDTWTPSMPFPETDREKKEKRDQERDRNRIKNENRRKAKEIQKKVPKQRVEAGKMLRHAFGGAFGNAPENVKFMAAQGTTINPEEFSKGNEGDNEDG